MVAILTIVGLGLILLGFIMMATLVGFIPGLLVALLGVGILIISGTLAGISAITDSFSGLIDSLIGGFSGTTGLLIAGVVVALVVITTQGRKKGGRKG